MPADAPDAPPLMSDPARRLRPIRLLPALGALAVAALVAGCAGGPGGADRRGTGVFVSGSEWLGGGAEHDSELVRAPVPSHGGETNLSCAPDPWWMGGVGLRGDASHGVHFGVGLGVTDHRTTGAATGGSAAGGANAVGVGAWLWLDF